VSNDSNKTNIDDLFPKECFICGKKRIQRNKKDIVPRLVTTCQAEATIKAAARDKMSSFYYEISEVDLIAKELQYHEACYKSFTHGYSCHYREVSPSLVEPISTAMMLTEEEHQQQGDYTSVNEYISKHVLKDKQAVSMSVLHSIYNLRVNDSRYRSKLKKRIQNDFKDSVVFLSVGNNLPEIVIDSFLPASEIAFQDKHGCLIKAAEYLRADILSYCEKLPKLCWPPTVEELSKEEKNPPLSLQLFQKHLLNVHHSNKKAPESVNRMMDSFMSDMIYAVSQRRTITLKHFLLALGLHSLTGNVIDIVSRQGHCLDYNTTCEIETAQAVKSQLLSENCSSLPLIPKDSNNYVLTVFWVDNFDMKVESQTGCNSIHTTHLVAFQEESPGSISRTMHVSMERTKDRQVHYDIPRMQLVVNSKKEPALMPRTYEAEETPSFTKMFQTYFLWLWLRRENSFDQQAPNFSGWLLQHRCNNNLMKTVQTYLPPINLKVNDFETIATYMEYLQSLAKTANMPFVNIILDVGAAMNAFKMVWNHPMKFKNVVIHLGDFHFMKENFQVRLVFPYEFNYYDPFISSVRWNLKGGSMYYEKRGKM
jgi:hypothetical protein